MSNRILKYLFYFVVLFLFSSLVESKEILNFNRDWNFTKGNPANAQLSDFDDSSWEKINLPHDWAIYGPFDSLADGETAKLLWRGEAWYRKKFNLNPSDTGKKIYLLFDGIMAFPKIYINGQLAGQWDYGYNSFYLDVSNLVTIDKENIIAIHVVVYF